MMDYKREMIKFAERYQALAFKAPARTYMTQLTPLYKLALRWEQENGDLFSPDTLQLYDGFFTDHIVPYFEGRTDITKDEMLTFMKKKAEEGFAETSIYKMQRLIVRVLEYGAALGECQPLTWSLDTGIPTPRKGATILTVEEQARLERFLVDNPGPKHLCLFLMLTTGIGVGEVMDLKWEDIQFRTSKIRVRTERGMVSKRKAKYRSVPIGERQKIYLRKMESLPSIYLWTGKAKQMSPGGFRARLVKVIGELILPDIRLSDLRHTYGVRCLEAGMTSKQLTKVLGLTDVRDVRKYYEGFLAPEIRAAREKEYTDDFLPKVWPKHIEHLGPDQYPEVVAIRKKIEAKKKELQYVLDNIEFDLDIINTLRNSDCVQGKARDGLYKFVEKVLGPDDKDGQYLVEYMRYNMRVATMPLRVNNVTTVQAIRSRVSHGFAKLCKRVEDINAVEGWDMLGTYRELCNKIEEMAPAGPRRTGPKGKPSVQKDYKKAVEALERMRKENEDLKARVAELEANTETANQ